MSLIAKILNSSLDNKSKDQLNTRYNDLLSNGTSEREAYIQVLTELKEQEETNLEQLYNQLQ